MVTKWAARKGQAEVKRVPILFGIAALAGIVGIAAPATATVTYNTTLASPNASASSPSNPSFYAGTGNPQGQFAVNLDSGIELGLSAIFAFVGPVVPPPVNNLYIVPTGVQTSGPGIGRAVWDYTFSIDLRPNGVGSQTLAAASSSISLSITDVTTAATGSFNPLVIPDNAYYGGTGNTSTSKHTGLLSTDWGAQNAESLSFVPGFNPWVGDLYRFDLTVGGVTDTIFVQAVPEPASMSAPS